MGIGHEQMAKHPCSFGPFPLVSADAEEMHEPVQAGMEVCLLHAGEPEQVSPEPRAEAVHELHGLEVSRVGHVGLVGLVSALGGLHECRMRPLFVVHDHRSRGYVGEQGVLDPLGGGLAVTADHGNDVPEGVDGDGDADLALGQAPCRCTQNANPPF